MKKILNYVLWISLSIFTILIIFILLNKQNILHYEIRNNLFLNLYFKIPAIFFILATTSLVIKSIITNNTSWTRWLSFSLSALFLLFIILLIITVSSVSKIDLLIYIVLITIGLSVFLTTAIIKNTYWTKWLSMIIFIGITLIAGLVEWNVAKKQYEINKDGLTIMQSEDNPKLKVIEQFDKYETKYYKIIKDSKFIIRYSRDYDSSFINGNWKSYDEFGNIFALNTYKNGVIIARKPIIPENAHLVSSSDSLDYWINQKDSESQYLCLNGIIRVNKPIHIKDKSGLTLAFASNALKNSIENTEDINSPIIIENCDNIIIDSIDIFLTSNNSLTPGVINIINSKNIIIRRSKIQGHSDYMIYVDSASKNIIINKNLISGYSKYGVYFLTEKIKLNENNYQDINESSDNHTNFYSPSIILSKENVIKIYNNSFQYLSDYDFNNSYDNITINDKQIGFYSGAFGGIFSSSGLFDAIPKYYISKFGEDFFSYSFYCWDLVQKLTAIPLFIQDGEKSDDKWGWYEEGGEKFSHVNPAFVVWASEKLIPEPETEIAGHSAQEIYSSIYINYFHLLVESYLYLQTKIDKKIEITDYQDAVDNPDISLLYDYLYVRYKDVLTEYNWQPENYYEGDYYEDEGSEGEEGEGEAEVTEMVEDSIPTENTNESSENEVSVTESKAADAIGFWIRREIDGSSESIYIALEKIMNKYDNEWYMSVKSKYTK